MNIGFYFTWIIPRKGDAGLCNIYVQLCKEIVSSCVLCCLGEIWCRKDSFSPFCLPNAFFFFLSPHLPHPSHHPFILKWDHVYVCLWFLFVLSRPLQYCDFLEILFPVCDYSLCPHTQLHLYPFLAFLSRQVFWFILSSDIATGFLALVLLFSHSLSFPPFFLRLTPSLLWLLGIILGLKLRRLQAWANNKNLWRQGIIQWGGGG